MERLCNGSLVIPLNQSNDKEAPVIKNRRKALTIVLVFLVLIAINVLPLFLFREKAKISEYSQFPIAFAALAVLQGVLAVLFRHKGNYLIVGEGGPLFVKNRHYTYTEAYKKEFRWMLFIYCAALPFYLPCIFFVTCDAQMLWAVAVFFAPQVCYFGRDVAQTLRDVKADKKRKRELQKELEEQKRREELGYWK